MKKIRIIQGGFRVFLPRERPISSWDTHAFFQQTASGAASKWGKGGIFMALTWVWVGMVCIALIFGAATGQSAAVGAAAAQGVQQAVTFCLTVGGMICLWSGVMEVMRRSGIAAGLSRLLQPVLRRLFPRASRDAQTLDALSMNMSANLLGLGNAATRPATSCACWWCSTRRPSSCCRSQSPQCARLQARLCRLTFCRPCG